MSRTGECLDNAVAERCFGSVKGERTALRYAATRQDARAEVIEYIEMFYHSKRLHSYVGYVSPHDFERLGRVASLSVRFYLTITVYTYRELDVIRIISAWRANRRQRLRYEKDRR
jgi:hypothetical protein